MVMSAWRSLSLQQIGIHTRLLLLLQESLLWTLTSKMERNILSTLVIPVLILQHSLQNQCRTTLRMVSIIRVFFTLNAISTKSSVLLLISSQERMQKILETRNAEHTG